MAISALSERARVILDYMEGDRRYEMPDLRAFMPDASVEGLHDVMHELWVNRQVERAGTSGWRRHRSSPAAAPSPSERPATVVKPEDLFDHDTFDEFFR